MAEEHDTVRGLVLAGGGAKGSYQVGVYQALMELGAVVCVPNGSARCEACPVSEYCLAYRHGTVEELPVLSLIHI